MKLLLVDGHNLLFQMFFGMPNRIVNADGVAIQGAVGFVGALNKIIDALQPTHIVVIFDGESCNPRREIDCNYKANRTDYSQVEDSQNPFSQLPLVYRALDFLGICHAETFNCETDDIVASYVQKFKTKCEIVIASFDSDYFQLIDQNVTVFRYRGKHSTLCDEQFVWQKYGVAPTQFADFKALVGDSADNIKGLAGIGPKTAQKLLFRFQTVQNLCQMVNEVVPERLRTTISNNTEKLLRNLSLVKLEGFQELPFTLEQTELPPRHKTMDVVRGIGL